MLRLSKRPREESRIARLRRIGLFSTLNARELRVVNGLLHERRYLKGEVVFDQGEEGQALYIVTNGKVLICRQGEPETGKIAEVPEGAMFGELALLDGSPRAAQARAADDTLLAALSRADFTGLVETQAVIGSKILLQLSRELAQKLRESNAAQPGSAQRLLEAGPTPMARRSGT
ncbi:MAG TPA: cyclic nucleotide-binding domain-containing protein [Burkholderiales bacterium]|nr:cyclic nucleotide-binding domain-containing protein [Burkholderiales bacterium]